jgi:hypothetical protein
MAGDEDEPQQVVADVVIHRGHVRLAVCLLPCFHVAPQLLQFPLIAGTAPGQVDGPVFRGRHQPGAGPGRDSLGGPLFERDDQRVLRQLLRRAHVARDPGQARDEAGRFNPPDRLDRGPRGPVIRRRRVSQRCRVP